MRQRDRDIQRERERGGGGGKKARTTVFTLISNLVDRRLDYFSPNLWAII